MQTIAAKVKNRFGLVFAATVIVAAASIIVFTHAAKSQQPQAPELSTTRYFLKIDTIDGESTDAQHKNEIELKSFSWGGGKPGLVQSSATGGASAGKVTVNDIHFVTQTSKASPKLMAAVASGKHFKEAVLSARNTSKKDNSQDYFKIKLSDVLISSYAVGGSGVASIDEFDISFTKVEEIFTPTKADGSADTSVIGSFDIKENKTF